MFLENSIGCSAIIYKNITLTPSFIANRRSLAVNLFAWHANGPGSKPSTSTSSTDTAVLNPGFFTVRFVIVVSIAIVYPVNKLIEICKYDAKFDEKHHYNCQIVNKAFRDWACFVLLQSANGQQRDH